MALILEKNYKGIICDYWKIIKVDSDFIKGKTIVRLGLYRNKETRTADINNYIDILAKTINGVDFTREKIYPILKEPVYDVNPMTNEQTQINEFVNALDDK